jgi:hypothetical protein
MRGKAWSFIAQWQGAIEKEKRRRGDTVVMSKNLSDAEKRGTLVRPLKKFLESSIFIRCPAKIALVQLIYSLIASLSPSLCSGFSFQTSIAAMVL